MEKGNNAQRKRGFELLAFLLIFIILSTNLMNILNVKGNPGEPRMYSVYEGYAKNTEVLFAGSSHAGQLLGRKLWEDYGIPAYTIAGNSQPVDIMYHSIKEFLKYEKPKVIMVETALIPDDSIEEPDTVYACDTKNDAPFRFSLNYLQMAIEQIRNFDLPLKSDGVNLLYKWPLMHDRYKNLTRDDFEIVKPYVSTDLEPLYSVPEVPVEIVTTDRREVLSTVGEEYLNKIIKLCKREKVELVLFHTPYPAPEISMAQQNTIADIAAENDVPFIDFNYLIDEIDFNPATDQSRDLNHVNYYGAEKLTRYLGDYLRGNYSLADHRQDSGYDNWNKDLEAWRDVFVKNELSDTNNIMEWSDLLAEDYKDYVVIMTLSGNYLFDQDGVIQSVISKLSLPDSFYENGGTLILDHGSVIYVSGDEKTYSYSHKYGRMNLAVDRLTSNDEYAAIGATENENDGIFIDGENYIKAVNGLSVTVYNDELEDVIDSVGIDIYLSVTELYREKISY